MNLAVPDTIVTFRDQAGVDFPVRLPRAGHTDREVRTVAYRWACSKIADGSWRPHGELRFSRLRPIA